MTRTITDNRHLVNEARGFVNKTIDLIAKDKKTRFGIKHITKPIIKTMGMIESMLCHEAMAGTKLIPNERPSILLSRIYMPVYGKQVRKWIYLHELAHFLACLKTRKYPKKYNNKLLNDKQDNLCFVKYQDKHHDQLFNMIEDKLCSIYEFQLVRDKKYPHYAKEIYFKGKLIAKRNSSGYLFQPGRRGERSLKYMKAAQNKCKEFTDKIMKEI